MGVHEFVVTMFFAKHDYFTITVSYLEKSCIKCGNIILKYNESLDMYLTAFLGL